MMHTPSVRAVALAAGALIAGSLAVAGPASAAASPPACSGSAVMVSHSSVGAATSHAGFALLLRNISRHSCTLYGYPGLDALDAHGHVLEHAERDLHGFLGGARSEHLVTLAAGHTASAYVEWINNDTEQYGRLRFSSSIATTPPGTTRTVRLQLPVGLPDLQVHPVVGGTSGNHAFVRAQSLWLAGARSDAASMGGYWTRAARYLAHDYPTQAGELRRLAGYPNTSLTAAQQAAVRGLTRSLDGFFGTPNLYF